jgi:hypothetical protein
VVGDGPEAFVVNLLAIDGAPVVAGINQAAFPENKDSSAES